MRGGISEISDRPGRRQLRLKVGERYRTNNGSTVVILETKPIERGALESVPAGWRMLCLGRCVSDADGTPGEAHIPLAWFENGFYGAHADHPLTICGVVE